MPYSDLLDHFEAVQARVEDANLSAKASISHVHGENSCFESHAKALLKQARVLDASKETGTLRDTVAAWVVTQENQARIWTELGKTLQDDFCEPQLRQRKDVKHANARRCTEGEKLVKELRKATARCEDARNKARTKRLEADTASANHEKLLADGGAAPKQIASAASKEKSTGKDADKAEAEHEAAVKKLDATRASYDAGMTTILKELEDQELSRIADVKRGLVAYVEAQRNALKQLSENLEAFSASVDAVHNAADINAFVSQTTASIENGEDVSKRRKSIFGRRNTTTLAASPMAKGSPSKTDAGDDGASSAAAADDAAADSPAVASTANSEASATSNTDAGAAAGAAAVAGTAGAAAAAVTASSSSSDVASGNPFGDDATSEPAAAAAAATPAASVTDSVGNPFGDDTGAAAETTAAADPSDPFATAAPASEETAPAASASPIVMPSDPFAIGGATDSPLQPAESPAAVAAATPEPQVQQPEDLFGTAAAAVAAPAAAAAAASSDPFATDATAAAAVPTAEIGKARALYDYDATAEGELSFKEDNTLIIVVKNPSGWWEGYIEGGDGQRGVFPSNFTEEI